MKKGNAGGLQRDNAAAMKKKSLFRMVKPYLFLLPIYLLMVTFKYIPFGMAIIKSFFNWNGANVNLFVGLDNYIAAFRDITFIPTVSILLFAPSNQNHEYLQWVPLVSKSQLTLSIHSWF